MKRQVSFGTDLGVASQKEELAEGPSLQEMPSEQVRQQLSHMATNIEKIMGVLTLNQQKSNNQELKKLIMQRYKQIARQEHHKILQRKHVIEERKEELENINLMRVGASILMSSPALCFKYSLYNELNICGLIL